MENYTKYVIIFDHANPEEELSFSDLKKVVQFMEESEVLTKAFQDMAEQVNEVPHAGHRATRKRPDFCGLADALMELTDKAEEYRDRLDSFIQEADALLDTLSDLDACWDDVR